MLRLPFRRALAIPGVLVAMTLVLVLVAAGGIAAQSITGPATPDASSAPAATCTRWNLAEDIRVSPNQENPSRDSCGTPGV
jgi:hypothetical protein